MKVTNSDKYHIDDRFLHIATLQDGLRRYEVIIDLLTSKMHLNETTTGSYEVIEDDDTFWQIVKLLTEKKITTVEADQPLEQMPWFPNKKR